MPAAAQRTRKSSAPPGRWPKRVLAVRVLQAKVAWLDAPLEWRDGRVVWITEEEVVRPEPSLLARTQRSLHKIRTYPVAAAEAFGDAEAWLAERQGRLELAKRLGRLHEPDLEALARRAKAGDAGAVARLIPLVPVEALSRHPLPVSPARTLAGKCPREAIRELVFDDVLPEPARALAALLWAAADREAPLRRSDLPEWVHRAAAFGRMHGTADEPVLAVYLLRDAEDTRLVFRCREALREGDAAGAAPQLALEWLRQGFSADLVVALLETLAALRPTLDRVRHQPPTPSAPDRPRKRKATADPTRQQRGEWAAALNDQWLRYAKATRSAESLRLAADLTQTLLDFLVPARVALPFLLQVFTEGEQLPPERRVSYLRMLTRHGGWFWKPLKLDPDVAAGRSEALWRVELHDKALCRVRHLIELLRSAREDLVERAVSGRLLALIHDIPGGDEAVGLALEIADETGDWRHCHGLAAALQCLGDPAAGTALLKRVFRGTAALEPALRGHLFHGILDGRHYYHTDFRRLVEAVAPLMDVLASYQHDPETCCNCSAFIRAAQALSCHPPMQARQWLRWLIQWVRQEEASWDYSRTWSLGDTLPVAVALSLGEEDRFRSLIRAGVRHEYAQQRDALAEGLRGVSPHPLAARVLSDQFPRQPGRCETLLIRLGLTPRFGASTRRLLDDLEPRVEDAETVAAASGWSEVLDHAPELLCEAAAYARACRIRETEPELPRGLRRILQLAERLRRELAHLRAKLTEEPHRSELAARVQSLEARLQDPQRLQRLIRSELGETLPILTRDLQLEALETLIDHCYRERLEQFAGPAGSVPLDDDLRNAALLGVDIDRNRKLLRRLLRSHLRGEKDWIREHPANQAFLEKLREAGVNTAEWLREHPRRYRCPGVKGEHVRLHLEQDPVRILQMGNYFDTCLSFGRCNSYSTVANACELNKRVIYAVEDGGRVVGRKLIGINEEGKLIGFHTYTSLPDSASANRLRALFLRFIRRFARLCGLEMAEQGTLPRLFAEAWYDDGVQPWKEGAEASEPSRLTSGREPESRPGR